MDDYEELEQLGSGAYGTVYRWRHRRTGAEYAAKRSLTDDEDGIPASALREASLMRSALHDHPCILRLVEVAAVRPHLVLLLELCEGNLRQSIKRGLERAPVLRFFSDLCDGVDFMHSHGFIHRDLKPQNLLLRRGRLKVGDLGMGRFHVPDEERSLTLDVVTPWYRDPNLLWGATRYSFELDVWSVGCILAEMISGNAIFAANEPEGIVAAILQLLGTPRIGHPVRNLARFATCYPERARQDVAACYGRFGAELGQVVSSTLAYDERPTMRTLSLVARELCAGG